MISWFRSFHDAVHEAHFRADVTRFRYRVYYDPANCWWNLRETTVRIASQDWQPR